MSDDNNVVVETTEEIQKAERSKKLKRRSSIGRFFDGVKSLLGLSTGNDDDEDEVEEKQVEETEVKTEQGQPEDKMDVEVAEDEDPEVDFAEEDEFLAEGEEVRPDPKLQAIKKMNLPKKEKIALSKQRSEELLEEDIKRVSQDEESSYTDSPKPVRRGGRPKKVARGRKATTKTTKAAKSPARSRSTSPSKSPSRSRSASPAKKTPAKRGGARKTPAKAAAKSPAKSTSTSPSRSRSASPAKKTPARATRKTPAKSPKTPRATRKTPAKAKAETRTPRTVGRKRKAEDPAEGESPVKKAKVTRRKSAPAKKREETKPGVTVTWPNTVLRQSYKGGKTFYSSVTVNGKKFSLGDTIYLISETGDEYIGIIENLYETKTGRNRAELQWYYKHEETNSTAKPVKGEVYQSDHIDANPIESFVLDRTPVVMHEDKIKDLNAYLAKPDHYYYNRFYDHDAKKFHNAKKDK